MTGVVRASAGVVVSAVIGALVVSTWGFSPLTLGICLATGVAVGVIAARSS